MRPRLEFVRDLTAGRIANAQLIFIDVGVVNPIDAEATQHIVVHVDFAFVMLEAERFEEILVDDDGAGGNDRVHHVVSDKIDDHILEAGGEERASQAKNDRAIFFAQHGVVNFRGAAEVAR